MRQLVDQQRAGHALTKVRELEGRWNAEDRRSFVTRVEGLPAAVLTNGLGQTLAVLLTQADKDDQSPPGRVYRILEEWLCRDDPQAPYPGAQNLLEALVAGDRNLYLRAQIEALAYLSWLKIFAVAFLKEQSVAG
jgi:CRISPR-associated protein Cmr5